MQTLASSHLLQYRRLFSDHFPKTHLQKSTVHRQNLTQLGSAFVSRASVSSNAHPIERKSSLAFLSPLEAILFDIDGTLCDSDPLHYYAFREMLQEVGFNGGVPITEEFFSDNLSGMHNEKLCSILFPEWDIQRARNFFEDKEAMFRRLASEQLEPVKGLHKLRQWIENQGLKRAAVTNAPRPNGELLISTVELSNFFEIVVVGDECDRAKPFPDPYLKALQALQVSHKHAFAFEDSVSGVKAGVAAGMPVVALGTRNPEISLINAGAAFVIKDFEDPKLWEALEEFERKAM
ncbi:haloacid dehalogenase-like hydrolase domain-containing protein Sgpp [Prunus persica]|uniref:haloacid dehalogenase-like hydrolase domain-containing protein Sgpp n=1 Tax=Prunus persica TaxID=3760 RepID=UPI0009AB8471|nr:haloacid dehalogenase-like hydrolase domain-containing protein Sgpp [Prunus persica]